MKFLQSKKGFTLVELMIVLILLGLGAFALINIFRVSYRSFNKTEERYTKQELVKTVAEYLQHSASLTNANKVEVYNTLNVIPGDGEKDEKYNYIFTDPETGYLYIKPNGVEKVQQITNLGIYLKFDLIPYEKTDLRGDTVKDINQSRGLKCVIAALEDNVATANNDGTLAIPSSDDIYYSCDVAYHFPNMLEDGSLFVNRYQNTITDYRRSSVKVEKAGSIKLATADEQKKNVELKTGTYNTVDTDGYVIRYVSDITLSGEDLMTNTNANMYCFIATASYGVNNGDGTVGMLCDFRDTCLLTNPLGTAFVKAYYKLSPPIADIIAQHEPLRAAVRVLLKPLVVFATYALNPELIYEIAPVMIITFAAGLALSVTLVRMNKKRKKKE